MQVETVARNTGRSAKNQTSITVDIHEFEVGVV